MTWCVVGICGRIVLCFWEKRKSQLIGTSATLRIRSFLVVFFSSRIYGFSQKEAKIVITSKRPKLETKGRNLDGVHMEQPLCKFWGQSVTWYGLPSQKTKIQIGDSNHSIARKLIARGEQSFQIWKRLWMQFLLPHSNCLNSDNFFFIEIEPYSIELFQIGSIYSNKINLWMSV